MAIKLFLSGVEYRMTREYEIREQAGASSTSSIDAMIIGSAPEPLSWQWVQLTEDDVPFFLWYSSVSRYARVF